MTDENVCPECGNGPAGCHCDHEAEQDELKNMLPPPTNPMAVARKLLTTWRHERTLTLRHWQGVWMRWQQTHWAEIDDREVRADLYRRLEHAQYTHVTAKGDKETRQWAPSKRKVSDLLEALAAITHLPSSVDAPSWIDGAQAHQGTIVACTNGLLRIADRTLLPLTPKYFNVVAVPFAYDPDAEPPAKWLEFLGQLWPRASQDDEAGQLADKDAADSIATVQEYFGYVLSGSTRLHKILLIVGPTRSGKGTIARTLTALVGNGNVAGPTLASLATNFGLQSLVGMPLAVISDARLSGGSGHQVVERLLTISGEDRIEVDRKYRAPWTGRLPTRFLILSNELPHFGDSSGVVARRFVALSMTTSWIGNENHGLEDELSVEMPGILNWALDGLDRLEKQGRLTEPSSSVASVTAMQDLASPTSAFVREWCVTGHQHEVTVDLLWTAWRSWCDYSGRDRPGTKQLFGRNLQSVAPQIRMTRPRDASGKQIRTYVGIGIKPDVEPDENETNNYGDRVSRDSQRLSDDSDGSASRAETRETRSAQLWDSSESRRCAGCGESMRIVEPGQTTHASLDCAARAAAREAS